MGALIGFLIGIVVSIPFFLFQWMMVWEKKQLAEQQEDNQDAAKGKKKLAWILMVQIVKLLVYALVLMAMSRTDTAHLLGAAGGLFLGILANGMVTMKKGRGYGRADR